MAKVALILVALSLLPIEDARAESVDSGSVEIKLTVALAKKLKQEGVRLVGLKPADAGKTNVTLPISNALFEPRDGSGYAFLGGGFRLQEGTRKAIVKRLVLNTSKRSLNAVVNGVAIKLATLPPQHIATTGFDLELGLTAMRLTPKAAATFNRLLGLRGIFKAGRSLGSTSLAAQFESLRVTGGEINLTIDNAFREKLQSVEAEVRPASFSTTLAGGQITSGLSGLVYAEHGLSFVQHAVSPFGEPFDHAIGFLNTYVSLERHTVSGAANVTFGPTHPSSAESLATIPASPIQFNSATGEAGASLPMALDPAMANLMNETIGASKGKPSLFSAGELLGTVGFTARTR